MRANYRMQRLYVTADLAQNLAIEATAEQFNYLANVLRFVEGAELLSSTGGMASGGQASIFPRARSF